MRVLHVINSLGASGGAEHGLVREITRFSPEVDQHVVRLFEKDQLDGELQAAGIPVETLGLAAARAGTNWPLAARLLRSVMLDHEPDVVHTSLFTANLVGQLAARRRVPVLSTLTLSGDVRLLKAYQPGADSLRASALRWVASRAAQDPTIRFRALTRDVRDTNAKSLRIDPDRIEVIPRGVPDRDNPDADRARFGIPDGVPMLVNVGRQTAQKGHLHLIAAFTSILQRLPDAHLAIAGRTGELSDRLAAEVAAAGLEERIHLLGYRTDVDVLLASGDAFVFSSLMEGLGTAVLEAMQAGIPVVAFDIPPVNEVTDGGALARLVPAGDEIGLAEAVVDLIESGAGPLMARRGVEAVATSHSLDAIASRVEDLLHRTANRATA